MTHTFEIIDLKLDGPVEKKRKFYLSIKVSEKYWFRTAEQFINENKTVPFL